MSNVSLYVVDLKRVQPLGMTTPRVTTVVTTGVNDLPKNVSINFTKLKKYIQFHDLKKNQFHDFFIDKYSILPIPSSFTR